MYLIEELWYDNEAPTIPETYGYKALGYLNDPKDAEKYCNEVGKVKTSECWGFFFDMPVRRAIYLKNLESN